MMAGKMGLGWKPGRGTAPEKFLLRDAPPAPPPARRTRRYWDANGWWGDQDTSTWSESECVIYSWLHAIHDGPLSPSHKGALSKYARPLADPDELYREAQGVDGTPTTDRESGLSCNAGASVMKARGYIGEYRWAETVDESVDYLLTTGPMTIGAYWYNNMFDPKKDGSITMTGGVAGGHQWVMDGVNTMLETIRCKNSWSRTWGRRGFFTITFQQMETMLGEGAEICVFRELPTQLPPIA